MKSTTTKTVSTLDKDKNNLVDIKELLHADHNQVSELFFQYQQTEDEKEKLEIVKAIIKALYVHAKAEEEIVYPAVRKKAEDAEDLIDEADTEHHVVKLLMAELSQMKPGDDHYDSKVTVLCELVNHHVREEEKEIFKKIDEAEIDVEKLGEKFLDRKVELMEEQAPKLTAPFKTNSRVSTTKK